MTEQTMKTRAPLVTDLVREGRITPKQGAMLFELRQDVARARHRKLRPVNPLAQVVVALGVFVLALFGIRKS
jgi:hypothetical protein